MKESKEGNKFERTLGELHDLQSHRESIDHFCLDTAALDDLVHRAVKNSECESLALFTSTVDSPNRARDQLVVKEHIGLNEEENGPRRF